MVSVHAMSDVIIKFVSNTRAQLEGLYDFKKASDVLAYRPPGYRFMRAYKAHVWDGYTRLLTAQGTFPAGLAWKMKEHLETEQKLSVSIEVPPRPALKVKHTRDTSLTGITLYPWQKKAVRVALERGRGVLKVATGGGKTEVMAGIIRCLEDERPPKTLVVVPNRNLLMQTKNRLESRLGYKVGTIGYGKWEEDYVTVAIPDTLSAEKFKEQRIHLMNTCEVLMLDEAHHAPSDKWSTLVGHCKAWYRFGLSGTPLDRGDGSDLKLMGQTGALLVDISSSLLVSQGKLAKPIVQMLDVKKPKLPKGLEWEDVYSLGIVRNLQFHKLVADTARKYAKEKKHVLILVTRIDHGDALVEELTLMSEEMVPAIFVHGRTEKEDLEAAVKLFQSGKLPVLIASPIFGEGTDLPNIDVLIVADGGKSVIKTVQKAGRAMRPKQGKPNECIVVDFNHYTHEKLLEHSMLRVATYKREEFEVNNVPVG